MPRKKDDKKNYKSSISFLPPPQTQAFRKVKLLQNAYQNLLDQLDVMSDGADELSELLNEYQKQKTRCTPK